MKILQCVSIFIHSANQGYVFIQFGNVLTINLAVDYNIFRI